MGEVTYYRDGDEIPGVGTVLRMTDTGYMLEDGGFAPFLTVHPRPVVYGLVAFADGSVYGGAR